MICLSISMEAAGMICLSAASGLIVRPLLSQSFFVTSVRGSVLAPQIAANESLNFFGAKIPLPAFFMAAAFFFAVADCAALPFVRFSALMVFKVAFVIVVFFVVVVGTAVFVVVVVMAFNG